MILILSLKRSLIINTVDKYQYETSLRSARGGEWSQDAGLNTCAFFPLISLPLDQNQAVKLDASNPAADPEVIEEI